MIDNYVTIRNNRLDIHRATWIDNKNIVPSMTRNENNAMSFT